jgi:hypothetical protein
MTPRARPSEALPPPRRLGRWITLFVLVAIASLLTWRGYGFYRLNLADRAGHPDYRSLSPAGFVGHGYGILGTALIGTNLLYLVRRRFARDLPKWVGSMKSWLNAHAVTGLVGALLIVFHSAFQLRTAIATVTSASLLIVVVTGLIGFYITALVPKADPTMLTGRLDELRALLPNFVEHVEQSIAALPVTKLPHNASLVRTLLMVPRWILQARARRRAIKQAGKADKLFRVVRHNEPDLAKSFIVELEVLVTKENEAHAAAAMLRSWRSLHRFLALLLGVSVSVHIGVAWFYGFRWIFE